MAGRLITLVAALLLGALALAGCAEKVEHQWGTWQLVSGKDANGELTPVPGHPVALEVRQGSFGGNAGCNGFGSDELSTSSGVWLPGEISMTAMGCEVPGVMELEEAFLAALADATSWRASEDELVLTGTEVELRFERAGGPEPAIAQGAWVLVLGESDRGALTLLESSPVTLEIGEDGTVRGTAACNGYSATLSISGSTWSFEEIGATEMWCEPPEVMALESAYLESLATVDAAQLSQDSLTLTGPGGVLLRFERES